MVNTLLEVAGFVLIVIAAFVVSLALGLLIAGVGFLLAANRPIRPPKDTSAGPA